MDFLANLAAGLLHVLGRLAMAFESPGEYNEFMLRIGWSTDLDAGGYMQLRAAFAATDPFENLENIFDQITSGTGDPVALAEQLVSGLMAILNEIRNVVAAPPSALPEPLNDPSFWSQSGVELVDMLLIDFLEVRQPLLESVLILIGFIDISPASPVGPNRVPYIRRTVHWDRLPQLINDPEGLIRSVYGWGGPALDVRRFFDVSQRIFRGLHLAARIEPLDATMVSRYYSAGNPALPMQQLSIPLVSSANAAVSHSTGGPARKRARRVRHRSSRFRNTEQCGNLGFGVYFVRRRFVSSNRHLRCRAASGHRGPRDSQRLYDDRCCFVRNRPTGYAVDSLW
jgi:hypothetical protein